MPHRDEENAEPRTPARAASALRHGPRRTWLIALLSVLGILAALLAVGLYVLANLDHPWVKGKVENMLSNLVGTEVRYEGLSLSPFSGLELRGLVVATPETLRSHAPDMLRLEKLRIPIELSQLFSGDVVIPAIDGGPVELTVVISDDGRNSFGELMQSEGDLQEAWPPLSGSLEAFEELSLAVGPVRLGPIRLSSIEVTGSGARIRQTNLEPLGFFSNGISFIGEPKGSAELRPQERDDVVLSVVDLAGDGSVREAYLVPKLEVRLQSGHVLEVSADAELRRQSLFPELRPVRSLLQVESSATFDPDRAATTLQLSTFTLFDSMLDATGTLVLEDVAQVEDDDSQDERALPALPFAKATIDARGELDVPSLPWTFAWLSIEDFAGRFELQGIEVDASGLLAGTFSVEGNLERALYGEGPLSVTVQKAVLSSSLSAPDAPTRTLGTLAAEASIDDLSIKEEDRFAAAIAKLGTSLNVTDLGQEDSGMWGLRGKGALTGSMQRVSVKARRSAAECKAEVALDVDLAKHEVEGSVPVEYFSLRGPGYDPIRVRDAQLDLVASDPTNWATDAGAPTAQVGLSAERVAVGKRRFRAPRSSVEVRRTGADQYALGARITADRVSWGSFPRDAKSSFELQALVDAQKPALDADASLAIAGGAPTKASLQASQNASMTRYELDVGGTDAGPLLGALLFEDGGLSSDELSFAFESSGTFRGLFSKDESGALVPSRAPLRTARGTHRSGLRVERLSLLRVGLTHQIRGLDVEASSTHESPGRGSLDARASMKEALYGESERPMSLHDYAQSLNVAYAAIHGAPSFTVKTDGTFDHLDQPYVRQYPIRDVSFGAEVDVDDTEVFAVRHAYMRNAAGGTAFEAKGSYEGWRDAIRSTEVCTTGLRGCPEVASMYGREAAMVTGTFEQDFSFWRSTERTKSGGSIVIPFTVESGDLNTYRVLATTEIHDVILELPEHGLLIENLDALIPVDQEFATAPEFFMVPARSNNAIAQKRFFDLYPFTKRDSFLTVDRVQLGQEVVGPVAANVHVAGSTIAMDQLHAEYRNGFVTGQFRADVSQDNPKVLFRGHLTGVRVKDGDDVLDANLAITFVPTTLIVEGKAQIVRVGKEHLYEMIDVLDPYHEDEDLNRVRLGLKFGYPKFVLIKLNEGLMNAKIDLGGLAGAVRIDEIKGIPVTPFLEQYVQPYIERILSPSLFYDAVPAESDGPPKVSQAMEGAR